MKNENDTCGRALLSGLSRYPEIAFVDAEQADFNYETDECADLYQALRINQPDASRSYLAVNFWRQLIWQPIYLNVASCYHYQASINVDQFSQRRMQHRLYGIHLEACEQHEKQDTAVQASLNAIAQCLSQCFVRLRQCCHLSEGQSHRIAADMVAHALLGVSGLERSLLHDALLSWQRALFNNTPTSYVTEENHLRVKLASCCLHLQVDPENPCFSCPKSLSRRKQNVI
ncbi:hypothetical protein [Veronia pacifica]|uniref:Ferric siderophore reductase C-terminal domain-containing protein n=1 Tax=Veronia pacifica TaxID=1080227 RepID=A0A1C3ESI9_9GAMM|nr:hypothetical protein [Veronia pacifica]ODA36175.1 hypothetical protein A8L45_00805 [Veronia pacifica]